MKSLHACRINLPGLCSHILISATVLVIMVRKEKIWHQKMHFKSPIWWSVFGNNALSFLIARGYSLYGKSKDVINYSNPRCKHKPKASDLDAKF